MQKLQNLILSLLFVTISSTASFPCFAETLNVPTFEMQSQITPRTDTIIWRYESFNGRLYRRLYNKTQDKWIGDWELVG